MNRPSPSQASARRTASRAFWLGPSTMAPMPPISAPPRPGFRLPSVARVPVVLIVLVLAAAIAGSTVAIVRTHDAVATQLAEAAR